MALNDAKEVHLRFVCVISAKGVGASVVDSVVEGGPVGGPERADGTGVFLALLETGEGNSWEGCTVAGACDFDAGHGICKCVRIVGLVPLLVIILLYFKQVLWHWLPRMQHAMLLLEVRAENLTAGGAERMVAHSEAARCVGAGTAKDGILTAAGGAGLKTVVDMWLHGCSGMVRSVKPRDCEADESLVTL